jgi:neutral amino acid transport system permease protein
MVETGLANAVVTGLVTGSIVALGAIGLALVYSIAEVPNFAHGELLMLGAYMALFVNRPSTVPVFSTLAPEAQTLTIPGYVVLFALTAAAAIGVVYMLGGSGALRGSWWPLDPNPAVALGVHTLAAAVLGAVVVIGFPSIWSGILLSALLLAVIAPLLERHVFREFREKGASLATMLIVALGLSFFLRFGTQAVYSGALRSYTIPNRATVFGESFSLSAARFFDIYATGRQLVVHVIDTGSPGDPTLLTVGYGWLAVAAVVLVSLALGAATTIGYRRRVGAGTTVSPRLLGTIVGLGMAGLLIAGTAGSARVPGSGAGVISTRVSLSAMRGLVIVIALLMMGSLHLLLQRTKLGTAMRAASDNKDLARISGINTDRVMTATWIIAGTFAAIGGVMLGVLFNSLSINMGFFLLLPMFAAVILGGIGSVYGAILGSYLVGLAMDVGIFAFDVGATYRVPIAFVLLFVVLLVRPEGIAGGG